MNISQEIKGFIDVATITSVDDKVHSKLTNRLKENRFNIKVLNIKKVFTLKAESSEEKKLWI